MRGAVLAALLAVAGAARAQGHLQNRLLRESSGLASSRQNPGVLWSVNDSGNDPILFAVGEHGGDLASFRVVGVETRGDDWEDIGTARLDGSDVLVIADTGDNASDRKQYLLHIVPEPTVAVDRRSRSGQVRPLRTVRFRYPDGSHDCEALGVEPDGSRALLISKTWWANAAVYSVSLAPGRTLRVAEPVGSIPVVWATAGAISADGRQLLVGTYGDAYRFRRGVGEPWAAALKRSPQRIVLPARPQGEGLAISADGHTIFASSEGAGTVLWRIPADPR